MISMKLEVNDEKVIVYLYNELIDINNIDGLNKKIKDLFIKIMKRYNLDFFGYSKVNVYHNENYGLILEIEKIYNTDIRYNVIDIKIIVYKNVPIYLEFDDYYFVDKPKKLIEYNKKYYLEINNDIDINKYIEYGKVKLVKS